MQFGDNVDTLKSEGLQFLTFKLSFNDYYAQDISNKIKSVKQRKIEKGEYQAGIPPYGYKKDSKVKNHLVPDEYSSKIVQEIFDMYVNRGMSTIKIADELNYKNIDPPAIYLKIPTYMKKNSKNPTGKYIWLRAQIGKILKNEVYLGNIVGRKFQKVSHKVAKVRCTKKEEHIVIKNMHEPIIDYEIWKRAQEKMNKKTSTRKRKYDHFLKGLIYCGECGSLATIRHREEKRKDGTIWSATYFICTKRNTYSKSCDCKQISAKILEDIIIQCMEKRIRQIQFTEEEIRLIYEEIKIKLNKRKYTIKNKILDMKNQLKNIEDEIEGLYQDKINKILELRDFKIIYEKKQLRRSELISKIKEENTKLKKIKDEDTEYEEKEFENVHKFIKEFLEDGWKDEDVIKKIIKKVEFGNEKNIKIYYCINTVY